MNERRGLVSVHYVAADGDKAATVLRARYGAALFLDHQGTTTTVVQARGWQLYTTNIAETEITVHSVVNPTIPFERIECDEGPDEGRVTVYERQSGGFVLEPIGADSATIKLEHGLGGRRVVDGATGRTRQRRAQRA